MKKIFDLSLRKVWKITKIKKNFTYDKKFAKNTREECSSDSHLSLCSAETANGEKLEWNLRYHPSRGVTHFGNTARRGDTIEFRQVNTAAHHAMADSVLYAGMQATSLARSRRGKCKYVSL